MIDRVILWSMSNRLMVVAAAVVMTLAGVAAMRNVALDAVPDISDVQVIVSTEWPGRSPDLIENQVTYPLVSALQSLPDVEAVRAVTDFGISNIYVVFSDRTNATQARSRVAERLQLAREAWPDDVRPALGPDATGVGWVFQYALVDESGEHTLDELRSLQDWTLRRSLATVPGVAEVASIGGHVKQYQVSLDPRRLAVFNLSPKQVVDAIRASNSDAEGRVLEFAGREYIVRARGLLGSVADIEHVSLGVDGLGAPIRVVDVAEVGLGPDIRRGIAELDGRGETVGGIVIMRSGENALAVVNRVKARLAEIQPTLPATVSVVPVYDRSTMVSGAISALRRTLLEEMLVVALVVGVFLSRWLPAVIPLVTLPITVLATFMPLWYFGVTANIMSLGGIALAIGVLIDAAIVMVENGHRRVVEEPLPAGQNRLDVLIESARQIGRPVFFSLMIIVVSFAPVFLLEQQEGRLFRPLALTKTVAMIAASFLALTLVPALMTVLATARSHQPGGVNALTRACAVLYERGLRYALNHRVAALVLSVALVLLTVPLGMALGREFMPPLYEGTLLYMPSAAPGLSITEALRLIQQQDRVLKGFPEVERVFGTAGRANTATDNSPLSMITTIVSLKPREQWRPAMTFEQLQSDMNAALQIPGLQNVWTQPIRGRLDMLFTGVKTPVGVKVLGPDLPGVQSLAARIERIVRDLPGTRSVYVERTDEGFYSDITIDRAAVARYGLTVDAVEEVVSTAIGGRNISRIVEGREWYPVNVRYQRDFRDDLPMLERVLVPTPTGEQVPLGRLATVAITRGPAMIRTENGQLSAYVYIDPATRDIGEYVARVREAVGQHLSLPPKYQLQWTGQYEFTARAAARLRLVVPIVLATILGLLVLTFRSVTEAIVVMLSVVYALSGGVVMQWLLGYQFSVAVWIGYIALAGVAVQTGIVMVIYLHEALARRREVSPVLTERDIYEATIAGAVLRLRPKLMTAATTIAGLLPILWSSGVGMDLMKPMAAPIVGGMVTSALHVLLLTPVLFFLMQRWEGAAPR